MKRPLSGNNKKILFLKTDLPAFLAVILFAGLIFLYLIPGFENKMMERKRTLLKEMTSSAYSILEYYHTLETKGALESEKARIQAKNAIGSIRYGEQLKDYFWITDRKPVMIIHPYRTDLDGLNLSEFRDSKGKLIFVEFAKAVTQTGESYVEYMWQWNDDSTKIVPKLSYVRLFEPWNWIIGTGIYIEDVRTEIRNMEFRSLIISVFIGIIIVILLSFMTRQSHRIEQKRLQTEQDLFHSREMYRTLAEAATEGVILWTGKWIQANKTLLSMLGFTEEEFKQKNIEEIITSGDINVASGANRVYDELDRMHFGESILRSADGNEIKVHSDYSRILLGENKAVVIVLRPLKQLSSDRFTLPSQLLKSIGTGFFRISFGRKTRFLDATEATLKILGYDNLDELLLAPVESIFPETSHLRLLKKRLTRKMAVTGMIVPLITRSGFRFESVMNIVITDHKFPEIWCEGSIEYLTASGPVGDAGLIPAGYYHSLSRETPVSNIMTVAAECSYDTPAEKALEIMKSKKTGYIVVFNNKKKPSGIAYFHLISTGLSAGIPAGTAAGKFISAEPDFIGIDKTLGFAFEIMDLHDGKPLLVRDENEKLAGIITEKEIIQRASVLDIYLKSRLEKAKTAGELNELTAMMEQSALAMISGKHDPVSVSYFISSTADKICRKAIGICLDTFGPPPCRFAFIQTGSAGRMEQTLLTDQDNGIIFEDPDEEKSEEIHGYFTELGRRVNELLMAAGFNLCKGNNMAENPKWSQPVSVWKEYFADWIRVPDPANLLDISIFFDFRHCYGDEELTRDLRDFVKNKLVTNDIYFHHMAAAWQSFQPPVIREDTGVTDIKKLLMPLTGLVRLYSLKYAVNEYSTVPRILALHSAGGFSIGLLRNTLKAFRDLTAIRLSHQAECIGKGLKPDNLPDLGMASENTLYQVNQAADNIRNLMLKAGTDFHTMEI